MAAEVVADTRAEEAEVTSAVAVAGILAEEDILVVVAGTRAADRLQERRLDLAAGVRAADQLPVPQRLARQRAVPHRPVRDRAREVRLEIFQRDRELLFPAVWREVPMHRASRPRATRAVTTRGRRRRTPRARELRERRRELFFLRLTQQRPERAWCVRPPSREECAGR